VHEEAVAKRMENSFEMVASPAKRISEYSGMTNWLPLAAFADCSRNSSTLNISVEEYLVTNYKLRVNYKQEVSSLEAKFRVLV